ncbi:unnamed protein product [Symbiodinium sp. CCMP2592]|nr:unnamed protein product [Symbiodinium sp. CCMP2592]
MTPVGTQVLQWVDIPRCGTPAAAYLQTHVQDQKLALLDVVQEDDLWFDLRDKAFQWPGIPHYGTPAAAAVYPQPYVQDQKPGLLGLDVVQEDDLWFDLRDKVVQNSQHSTAFSQAAVVKSHRLQAMPRRPIDASPTVPTSHIMDAPPPAPMLRAPLQPWMAGSFM